MTSNDAVKMPMLLLLLARTLRHGFKPSTHAVAGFGVRREECPVTVSRESALSTVWAPGKGGGSGPNSLLAMVIREIEHFDETYIMISEAGAHAV